ncbi:hypothetical protein KSP40_PGU019504 [Platanthera guangdongensis]|uniref:Uncharacterized protein n=1 Tax=Platanthera guangdongensis TaxID=2320717 RepID=A0ABR2MCH5_9ASPA
MPAPDPISLLITTRRKRSSLPQARRISRMQSNRSRATDVAVRPLQLIPNEPKTPACSSWTIAKQERRRRHQTGCCIPQ